MGDGHPSSAACELLHFLPLLTKTGVCRTLSVPVTEHSREDGEILYDVMGLGLPPSATLSNVHLLFRKLGFVLISDWWHQV